MTDIDYGALFEIDEGGNEQEAAEPAEETTEEQAQGGNEQETAEPAEGEEETQEKQTPEQNAAFAAARRKAEAERDAAVKKAQEDAQRMVDEAFKNSGLMNPYTDKPITSKAEYDEYRKAFAEDKKEQLRTQAGLSEAEYAAMVKELPEVKQAREAAEKAEKALKEADEIRAKAKIGEQIKEIAKLDASIKELGDLAKMDNYETFYGFVKKGNTLLDAYKLANFDRLMGKSSAATKQAAYNSIQSKEHMGKTKERGTGSVSVPNDIKEMYRALNPDATDAEISAHYNKYHKN